MLKKIIALASATVILGGCLAIGVSATLIITEHKREVLWQEADGYQIRGTTTGRDLHSSTNIPTVYSCRCYRKNGQNVTPLEYSPNARGSASIEIYQWYGEAREAWTGGGHR